MCLLSCKKNVDVHAGYMLINKVFLSKLYRQHNKVRIKEYQLKYTMLPQKKKKYTMIHFYGLKICFSDFCFLTLIKGFIVRAGI